MEMTDINQLAKKKRGLSMVPYFSCILKWKLQTIGHFGFQPLQMSNTFQRFLGHCQRILRLVRQSCS